MNRLVLAALAAVAFGTAPICAVSAQEAIVSAADPESLRAQFSGWGYQPTAMTVDGGIPIFTANISGVRTVIVFGGCTAARNCNHIVLLATYSDVVNPPYDWLNRQNFDFNLVTVMRNENGLLNLRSGVILGNGVRTSTLRFAIQDWIAVNGEVTRRAREAGIVRK